MSRPGSAEGTLAPRGAEFYAAVIVMGFCSGVMTGLTGAGSGLTFVCGWNVSFLIYEAALGSSSPNKNPFAEYDDLVGIMVVCSIFVNSYSALLHRHKVWSLRRLIPCLMLPSLCLCPVGAWVYRVSDITTVHALTAHLLFWFAFGWICLHPPSSEMNPASARSGKMQSCRGIEDESGSETQEATATASSAINRNRTPRARAAPPPTSTTASSEINMEVDVASNISKDGENASPSRLEANISTTSTGGASTRSSTTEATMLEDMNVAIPLEAQLSPGERQEDHNLDKHVLQMDEHEHGEKQKEGARMPAQNLPPIVRAEAAVSQEGRSRTSVDDGTPVSQSDAVAVPRYVYFCVVCAACSAGFFGGLMGLTGPPVILLGLVLPPSVYPASVARALSVLGLSVEPYARAFYVRDKIDFGQCGLVYASALSAGVLGVWFGSRVAAYISERIFRLILCGLLTGTSLIILGIFEGNELALAMLGLLVLGAGAMHVIGRRKFRAGGSTPCPPPGLGGVRCWRKNHNGVAP